MGLPAMSWMVPLAVPSNAIRAPGSVTPPQAMTWSPLGSCRLAVQPWESTIELTVALIATFVPLILAVAIWVRLVERRPVSGLGFGGGRALRRFSVGFAVGAVSMTLTAALILLSGQGRLVPATETATVLGRAALPLVAAVLIGWFVQSCAEEVYLQGWLLPKAASTFGLPIGVGLSSLVFFLMHTGNDGMTALARTNLLLYGTFAAIYALYEGSVLGIWGYHFAWNLTQANVFGLSVSGTAPHSASIVQIHTDPQGWLVGGGFGPEGGPITTAVLVASITVLVLLHRHRAAHRPPSQAPDGMKAV